MGLSELLSRRNQPESRKTVGELLLQIPRVELNKYDPKLIDLLYSASDAASQREFDQRMFGQLVKPYDRPIFESVFRSKLRTALDTQAYLVPGDLTMKILIQLGGVIAGATGGTLMLAQRQLPPPPMNVIAAWAGAGALLGSGIAHLATVPMTRNILRHGWETRIVPSRFRSTLHFAHRLGAWDEETAVLAEMGIHSHAQAGIDSRCRKVLESFIKAHPPTEPGR